MLEQKQSAVTYRVSLREVVHRFQWRPRKALTILCADVQAESIFTKAFADNFKNVVYSRINIEDASRAYSQLVPGTFYPIAHTFQRSSGSCFLNKARSIETYVNVRVQLSVYRIVHGPGGFGWFLMG